MSDSVVTTRRFSPPALRPLVWIALAGAAIITGWPLAGWLMSVRPTVSLARSGEANIQRTLNGPLMAYAQQLESVLPLESCLQFIHPAVAVNRPLNRMWYVPNIYVLSHRLYPRQVLLTADADEALAAPECRNPGRYVLVWIEPEFQDTAAWQRQEMQRLQAHPAAVLVSRYTDEQGNTGATFRIDAVSQPGR